jgi:ferric-dicitrate binding protein FerR (iron transport regulator)
LTDRYAIHNQRLDEIVWEFNRYNYSQIVFEDPQVAELRMGGAFDLRDLEGFF